MESRLVLLNLETKSNLTRSEVRLDLPTGPLGPASYSPQGPRCDGGRPCRGFASDVCFEQVSTCRF